MYNLGVIGGMGSLATAEYFRKLVTSSSAKSDSDHINVIILNHATLPDRSECILNNTPEKFLDCIKSDFEILNNAKVNAIAIPCNTSHYYYNNFLDFTNIPVINMVEKTILAVKSSNFSKACVFGTKGTLSSKIYNRYANEHGIELVNLPSDIQNEVMKIIYDIKENGDVTSNSFNEILSNYCDEETIGIIACTELSLIPITSEVKTIDALDVLVRESLKYNIK
ncbi:aspartate/glutamate racemase family protein [Actinomyces sp. zg-332]|uniref:aspartate/glutamate racemase family protein n=1 Tax=Actinomyces sp. zg-332 TaxID=2708340 RepID=UPI00141FBD41|nr:amino acid racemase [Actinomyces sp. zg-332]QPK93650.1 aspartate/glutamate racemase family protein [Actinomyces sp. zg-332]